MTDENDSGRPTPAPGGRAPLTLKPRIGGAVSSGMVKQSFSHGRSKTVVVETKRRRVDAPGAAPAAVAERRGAFEVRGAPPARPTTAPTPATTPAASVSAAARGLSEDERRARQRVIEEARRAQERAAAERQTSAPEPVATAPSPAPEPVVEIAEPVAEPAAQPEPAPEPVHVAEPVRRPPEPARPAAAATRPIASGQTRTYEPSRDRRDDRPSTTTYRPERSGVAFNQRVARPDADSPRDGAAPDRPREGGPQRPARPGETVRYSATAPRPARDGARPGGPRTAGPRPAAAPAEPEFQRASRQTPRPGSLNLDRRPDFDDEDGKKARAGAASPSAAKGV